MVKLLTPRPVLLTPGNRRLISPRLIVPALTAQVSLSLQRPTAQNMVAWGDADVLRTTLVFVVDGCPDTGATCSVGVETTVKGKSVRIMEWFIIMVIIAGFAGLMAQSSVPMKPKMARN